jgi:glycosyltransferase involved in cell wall biosynthesis
MPELLTNREPFRVLHLNSLLTGGGTDDQCVKLVHNLHRLGQQVWLAGPEGREFSALIGRLGVPFVPTPPATGTKLRFILAAARFIREQRVQIVHGHHGRDYWPTVLAARLSGARPKIVLTRHLAKSPSAWASRRFLLGQCDAVIAVSEFVARVLREGAYEPDSPEPERRARHPMRGDHAKVRVIYGGLDTDRFRPLLPGDPTVQTLRREWGLAPEHFAFAVAGGYNFPRGKGQREFLQAAARIHEQAPPARFLIIGRGNMADLLRDDIARLGLTGKARLTPYCRDMPAAMNALDCLVHPQIGTEAFGLVLLEAFACGKPVIASALDGIPEAFAVGGAGRLVRPESVDELAAAMAWQACQPALKPPHRDELHARVAQHFSWSVAARGVMETYQTLMRHERLNSRPSCP